MSPEAEVNSEQQRQRQQLSSWRTDGAALDVIHSKNLSYESCAANVFCITRNLIKWFFNKIKACCRFATRYNKLAANSVVRQTRINPNLAAC
jgi:hypothetical protein